MAIRDLIPWRRRNDDLPVRRAGDSPFLALQKDMNRLFERFPWNLGVDSFLDWPGSEHPFAPNVDISQDDETIRVQAELPGMDESDLDVSLADGVLTLQGEKREQREEKSDSRYYSERRYGRFRRDIPLPTEVDEDGVQAAFKKGVLTVTLPKTAKAREQRKQIEVKPAP